LDVSVVVPSWNTRDLLRACLAALQPDAARRDHGPSLEVTVVDNASQDGSADMVEREFPAVLLVRNERNEGFARACNQGLEGARGRHVLLLNADARVEPAAVAQLVSFLDSNPGYAGAAPRLLNPDGTTQRSCMAFPGWWTPLCTGTILERIWPQNPERRRYFLRSFDHESDADVEQPAAACLLLRRSCFEALSGLDERLWLFFNDVDLCKRLQAAGGRLRFLAEARVFHQLGASTSQFEDFVAEWHANRLHYYRKHHGRCAGVWVKLCTTLSWMEYCSTQLARRLMGKGGESGEVVGTMTKKLLVLLRQ
jgi:GT2 family glycosyltransferase